MTTNPYDTGQAPVEPPSFEPYVGRVRMIRAVAAASGFVLVGAISYTGGMAAEDAVLRAMAVAVVSYFMAWGAALWLFSELYFARVGQVRARMQEAQQRRADQLQEMYVQRLSGDDSSSTASTSQMQRPAV